MGCEPAGFEYMYVGLQLTPKLWANTPVLGACWLAALTLRAMMQLKGAEPSPSSPHQASPLHPEAS